MYEYIYKIKLHQNVFYRLLIYLHFINSIIIMGTAIIVKSKCVLLLIINSYK